MCCNCDRAFEPSERLKKMLCFLAAIGFINLAIALLHIYPLNSASFFDIIICIIVLVAYRTLLFYWAQIYIFLSILCLIFDIDTLGVVFQEVYGDNQTLTSLGIFALVITTFSIIFYFFAIFIMFGIYKEMRAEFYENAGMRLQGGGQGNEDFNNQQMEGGGAAWGGAPPQGGNNQNEDINRYRANMYNANNNANRGGGNPAPHGYVPFGGRGVAVGGN